MELEHIQFLLVIVAACLSICPSFPPLLLPLPSLLDSPPSVCVCGGRPCSHRKTKEGCQGPCSLHIPYRVFFPPDRISPTLELFWSKPQGSSCLQPSSAGRCITVHRITPVAPGTLNSGLPDLKMRLSTDVAPASPACLPPFFPILSVLLCPSFPPSLLPSFPPSLPSFLEFLADSHVTHKFKDTLAT